MKVEQVVVLSCNAHGLNCAFKLFVQVLNLESIYRAKVLNAEVTFNNNGAALAMNSSP
jgi:hypothetical protein